MKSAIRRPILAPIGLVFCLTCSLAFVSCREERQSSQQALRKLGYHFTADDFLRAAAAGDQAAVEQFLEYRMPLEMADTNGDSALIHAAANGHTALALRLIELGAEVNRAGKFHRTALMRAAENGHAETVKLLLDADANPNAKDTKDWSALTLAVYGGHSRAAQWLAKRSTNHLDAAVLVAAIQGNPEIVELMIQSGAIVETRNASGQTPLMLAA
ncbi:MAG: ankyrin repeat domain-containing protein, partial [Verrucomicrobiota bacterium]